MFEERPAVIGRRTLEVLLYDFDAYSRHICIGATQIALAHVDLSDKVELWKHLTQRGEQDAKIELGELMVSLSYLPSAERLTVVLIKARNLRVVDDSRNSTGEKEEEGNILQFNLSLTDCLSYSHPRSVREGEPVALGQEVEEAEDGRATVQRVSGVQRGADLRRDQRYSQVLHNRVPGRARQSARL